MSLKVLSFFALIAFSEALKIRVQDYAQAPVEKKKDEQDFSKIPGVAGHDFPIFHEFPETSFDCASVPAHPGIYANVETGCQGYHVCNDGREGPQGSKFLCTNGTIFSQKDFNCDWWYNVDCNEAQHFYRLNADPDTNPYTKDDKKKALQAAADAAAAQYHQY